MPIHNKTIRRMPGPTSKSLARLINEQTNLTRRLKNLLPKVIDAEFAQNAMLVKAEALKRGEVTGNGLSEHDKHILAKTTQDIHF